MADHRTADGNFSLFDAAFYFVVPRYSFHSGIVRFHQRVRSCTTAKKLCAVRTDGLLAILVPRFRTACKFAGSGCLG